MNAAAEMLRKGGTLVAEVCSVCKGVQVKYSGKIVCVNCGKEEEIKVERIVTAVGGVVNDLRNTVLVKINELLPILKSETDIGRQEDLVKLIICYLEALEKIPKDKESRQ